MRFLLCLPLTLSCAAVDALLSDRPEKEPWTYEAEEEKGVNPRILRGGVYTSAGNQGPCTIAAVVGATDPQGPETLSTTSSTLDVVDADNRDIIEDLMLICDEEGECVASFREDETEIRCANGSRYRYFATIVDEDGNKSLKEPLDWEG